MYILRSVMVARCSTLNLRDSPVSTRTLGLRFTGDVVPGVAGYPCDTGTVRTLSRGGATTAALLAAHTPCACVLVELWLVVFQLRSQSRGKATKRRISDTLVKYPWTILNSSLSPSPSLQTAGSVNVTCRSNFGLAAYFNIWRVPLLAVWIDCFCNVKALRCMQRKRDF